jgi:hypothetical protein
MFILFPLTFRLGHEFDTVAGKIKFNAGGWGIFFLVGIINSHSCLKLFTGFAIAALTA